MLVRHLEAATSKEESLLLLMGLSRLPGGRQFAPQADATVELRVVEGDGQGKTFSDTPLEIGVRLRKGARYEGDWVTTAGLVREFDVLIPRAWQKLAASLGGVRPEAADSFSSEMALRRKQADAELRACPGPFAFDLAAVQARLAHAEAALKLDPTYPEAAAAYLGALDRLCLFYCLRDHVGQTPPETALRTIREAARYVAALPPRRRRVQPSLRQRMWRHAVLSAQSPLRRCLRRPLEACHQTDRGDRAQRAQGLEAVKQLVERALEDDIEVRLDMRSVRLDGIKEMIVVTHRGMRLLDVPAPERQAWLEKIYRRLRDKMKKIGNTGDSAGIAWFWYVPAQIRIAELCIEDGRTDRAKQVLVEGGWKRRPSSRTPCATQHT